MSKEQNTPAPQVEMVIELPELPEPQKECWIGHDLYSADQMRAYAQAALNARAGGDGELAARFKLACRTLTRDRVVFGEDVETLHEVLRIIEADYAPLAGTYEWFDSVEEVWRPIDRLPYKWERELGIPWRDAALANCKPEGV